MTGTITIRDDGPCGTRTSKTNRWLQKVVPFPLAVKRALKRETDEQVIRRWARGDKSFNLAFLKPYKFDKQQTPRAIRTELGRQAKRMASSAGTESITSAGVVRSPGLEVSLYNAWMSGVYPSNNAANK